MRLDRGLTGRNLLFALFVALYLIALGLSFADKLARVGAPDIGWLMDGGNISPSRWDSAAAGLRGGGRARAINGLALSSHSLLHEILPGLRWQLGQTNTITVLRAGGKLVTVTLPVRLWTWDDALFAEGATMALGALFAIVGITTFILRPYRQTSWALLLMCCVSGGLLSILFVHMGRQDAFRAFYFRLMVGLTSFAPYHLTLAMPLVHPLLLRRPSAVLPIYTAALGLVAFQFTGWLTDWPGPFAYSGTIDTLVLLVGLLLFTGRCAMLSLRANDPLIRQRARILTAGAVFGLGPLILTNFFRTALDWPVLDVRISLWSVGLFLIALAHVTLREELLNARIAVQRAAIYAAVVGLLTLIAVFLVSLNSFAVGILLLPLLYGWPRFNAALDQRLYPKRARLSELLRRVGDELSACTRIDAVSARGPEDGHGDAAVASAGGVLPVLASAPHRLCDSRSAVAFLLADAQGGDRIAAFGVSVATEPPLAQETLIQVLRSLRTTVLRQRIALDPQYASIVDECYAGFERFDAEVILPILQEARVVGGLAIGARASGDIYEPAELEALSTVAQQALQSVARIEAAERLRARELEFADLKRFFPPQVIDQVMARGGAAELRSQRKLVTIVFADLRGFTSFADSVEPEELLATLAEYHDAMGRRIAEYGGTLERFAGDGLMVFFNDPVEQADHAERAVRMAMHMRTDVAALRDSWRSKGYQVDVGMGIHTGYATCGFIGYEGRRDYAVVGTVTNLASRLSDAAAGGEILISARLRAALPSHYEAEAVGELNLKGFHQPQPVFRLLGTAVEASAARPHAQHAGRAR